MTTQHERPQEHEASTSRVKMIERGTLAGVREPGDYIITDDRRVILACPVCGGIFVTEQKVERGNENPLTLSPSVLGPATAHSPLAAAEVNAPCKHHFWIKNGEVIE